MTNVASFTALRHRGMVLSRDPEGFLPLSAVHQVLDKMIPRPLDLSTVLREMSEHLSFGVPYKLIAFIKKAVQVAV